jgi:hypothetical protein
MSVSIRATIVNVENAQDFTVLSLHLDRSPANPAVPAFLFDISSPSIAQKRDACAVLEWMRPGGPPWQFECRRGPLVSRGQTYGFQSMWTPLAFDAVTNLTATWAWTAYPDDGTDEHCLVTFRTISAAGPEKGGYFNEEYGWLSQEAYSECIVRDVYGIRSRIRTGAKLGHLSA